MNSSRDRAHNQLPRRIVKHFWIMFEIRQRPLISCKSHNPKMSFTHLTMLKMYMTQVTVKKNKKYTFTIEICLIMIFFNKQMAPLKKIHTLKTLIYSFLYVYINHYSLKSKYFRSNCLAKLTAKSRKTK